MVGVPAAISKKQAADTYRQAGCCIVPFGVQVVALLVVYLHEAALHKEVEAHGSWHAPPFGNSITWGHGRQRVDWSIIGGHSEGVQQPTKWASLGKSEVRQSKTKCAN